MEKEVCLHMRKENETGRESNPMPLYKKSHVSSLQHRCEVFCSDLLNVIPNNQQCLTRKDGSKDGERVEVVMNGETPLVESW